MLAGLVAATALGACAGRNCSGSAGSTANPNDLAGCGGSVDRIYNELYTPGDPSWSQF
jgi:hypothetical protein